jgi:hypothetical protein
MSGSKVKTPIVDKNGKQTSVWKNTDSGESSRQLPVISLGESGSQLPEGWNSRDENNADIDDLVAEYVDRGVLHPTRTMNGDRNYETGDIFVGRQDDGTKIYVNLRLEHINKERLDQDLNPVGESWDFSMTGSRKLGRHHNGGGQITEDLLSITKDSPIGKDEVKQLHDIWDDNHLNSMHAGTKAQEEKRAELIDSGVNPGNTYDILKDEQYYDNGYRYGSKWLHSDVPAGIVETALDILSRGDRNKR